jgi:GTP-binding protein HflX
VLVEDALFATLDPTVRRARTPEGRLFTLADTVGFVRHLPHQLVEAFRSTLEEVGDADLILHVVDGSHPDPESQLAAVREVFSEIEGASEIPEIVVINKADAADPVTLARLTMKERRSVVVSARTGAGIDELMTMIETELPRLDHEVRMLVPYDRADLVARAHKEGEVLSLEHTGDGTILHARVLGALFAELDRAAKPVETV